MSLLCKFQCGLLAMNDCSLTLTVDREISTLLARSFFMGFSLTVLSLLARIRVLVQQVSILRTTLSFSNYEVCAAIKNDTILIILKAHSLVILIIVKVLHMDCVILKFEVVEVLVSSRIHWSHGNFWSLLYGVTGLIRRPSGMGLGVMYRMRFFCSFRNIQYLRT